MCRHCWDSRRVNRSRWSNAIISSRYCCDEILPYFEIIQPSSPLETKQIIAYVRKSKKPTYLRIARNEVTEFLPKNYKFKIGYPAIINKGKIT